MTKTASSVKLDARSASETLVRTNAIVEWVEIDVSTSKSTNTMQKKKHQSYIVCRGNIDLLQQEIPFDW